MSSSSDACDLDLVLERGRPFPCSCLRTVPEESAYEGQPGAISYFSAACFCSFPPPPPPVPFRSLVLRRAEVDDSPLDAFVAGCGTADKNKLVDGMAKRAL